MKDPNTLTQRLIRQFEEFRKRIAEVDHKGSLLPYDLSSVEHQSFLEIAPFKIDIIDEQGKILFFNEKMSLSPQFTGKHCWEVYKEDRKQCSGCPLEEPIELGETQIVEVEGIFRGETFQVTYTGINYGGKKAFLRTFHDVTQQRLAFQKLSILLEIGQHIASNLEMEKLLQVTIKKILETTGVARARIRLMGDFEGKGKIEVFSIRGEEKIHVSSSISSDDPDVATHQSGETELGPAFEVGSEIRIPLMMQDQVIGSMDIAIADIRTFTAQELEFYETIAHQLSCMVVNARLYMEAKSSEANMKNSEMRYREIFEESPLSLWEEDHSQVYAYLQGLKELGIKDFRGYLEKHPEAVVECLKRVKIVDVNKATLRMYGARDKKELRKCLVDFFCPQSYEVFKEQLVAMAEGKRSFESETLSKAMTGEIKNTCIKWSVSSSSPIPFSKVLVSVVDITQSKQAEEFLKMSEIKYRTLVENIQDGVFIIQEYKIQFANRAFARMVGYEVEEIIGKRFEELVFPEDFPMVLDRYQRRGRGEMVPSEYEFRMVHKDHQTPIYVNINVGTVDYRGKIASIGTVKNIGESKRVERILRESEEKFRTLAEESPNMIFINKKGKVVYANKKCSETMGYTREEFYAPEFNFMQLMAPESIPIVVANFQQHRKGEDVPSCEYALITKKGKKIEAFITTKLIDYEGEISILGIVTDISELKKAQAENQRMQKQLLQSQKMEAIGRLAGGIAHDFNNMLTAILGFTDFVLEQVDPEDALFQDVREIKSVGEQAASLTRQLLTFSRKQLLQSRMIDLGEAVARNESFFRRTIGEDIVLTISRPRDLACIKADMGQMDQLLMNLVINARDAMPDGGKIDIRLENVLLDETTAHRHEAKGGYFVCLSVEDTGVGISTEILPQIFEPFFTTKDLDKGTGLGLSVVYGIVKQHQGWVNVESTIGKGTVFKIYLPAFFEIPETVCEQTTSSQDLKGKGERVLVVEDELNVSRFVKRALSENGYEVVISFSARQTLEIFKEQGYCFDLLFVDVVLPDKNGLETIDELLSLSPGLKVLLTSGHADEKSQIDIIQKKGLHFLQKPYTVNSLLSCIKEVLGTFPRE